MILTGKDKKINQADVDLNAIAVMANRFYGLNVASIEPVQFTYQRDAGTVQNGPIIPGAGGNQGFAMGTYDGTNADKNYAFYGTVNLSWYNVDTSNVSLSLTANSRGNLYTIWQYKQQLAVTNGDTTSKAVCVDGVLFDRLFISNFGATSGCFVVATGWLIKFNP